MDCFAPLAMTILLWIASLRSQWRSYYGLLRSENVERSNQS